MALAIRRPMLRSPEILRIYYRTGVAQITDPAGHSPEEVRDRPLRLADSDHEAIGCNMGINGLGARLAIVAG